jgi:hypothetical protein
LLNIAAFLVEPGPDRNDVTVDQHEWKWDRAVLRLCRHGGRVMVMFFGTYRIGK